MLVSEIWNEILVAAQAQSGLEWLALVTNLAYVILAARGNRWCWWFGGVGAISLFIVVAQVSLYSDALLQVYYFGMAIYGWFSWQAHREAGGIEVQTMSSMQHLQIIGLGIIVALALGWFWSNFEAAYPYIDGATTAFSLLATLLVTRRYIENWLYWIVIDLVGIIIYYLKDLYLISFLFLIYTIISIVGWVTWKKWQKKPRPQ